MKSYLTKFKSFLWKIVQMGTLQKLQNSIQTLTLIIFWPVYPIHTNSLFWVVFVELPFPSSKYFLFVEGVTKSQPKLT